MVDAVMAGRGVVDYPGLYPIPSGYVLANISGVDALPVAVALGSLPGVEINVGVSPVVNGATTNILYNNAGTLGEYTISGTGTVVAMATAPVFTTPTLGVAAGTSLALGGATIGTDALGVTGTTTLNGNVSVVSSSFGLGGNISAPTWTTNGVRYKNVAATLTDTTAATGTTATAYTDVWGGNTIAATSVNVVYTNYYGGYFKAPAAGTNVTLTNAWGLGADSLAIGTSQGLKVATTGALTTTSTVLVSDGSNAAPSLGFTGAAYGFFRSTTSVYLSLAGTGPFWRVFAGTGALTMGSAGGMNWAQSANADDTADLFLARRAAANLQHGVDAAAPVAQTESVGNVSAGTSNIAGANYTFTASRGTGTGVGGDWAVQIAPAGTTGTTQNTLVAGLTVKGTGSVVLGSAAIATNATDGFIYAVSGAGTPTGTPTAFTGRVPIYVDTTNSQLWLYLGGAWKQPKTPAAAAIVTWQ